MLDVILVRKILLVLLLTFISANLATAATTEDCKECHLEEYDMWKDSPHYTEPVVQDTKPGVESCLPCHAASTPRLYSK
ncbi:hypothetical protein [Methanolobus profundi]|uniref:hypothetical protein n=1 Tax=Methanolobus profundi TaxID=487685 RepID=UPI0011607547|nr:hypothetical protein [Methanolobus profundi]